MFSTSVNANAVRFRVSQAGRYQFQFVISTQFQLQHCHACLALMTPVAYLPILYFLEPRRAMRARLVAPSLAMTSQRDGRPSNLVRRGTAAWRTWTQHISCGALRRSKSAAYCEPEVVQLAGPCSIHSPIAVCRSFDRRPEGGAHFGKATRPRPLRHLSRRIFLGSRRKSADAPTAPASPSSPIRVVRVS